ncbi:hypothetical protein [Dyadobacter sp. CY326]|uniref:hypothetical protein n=1 Tax=Dyadobacter sp. CY326 TaxID=2907300 RepID=UPI001F3E191E|nr:hypothetical protein [Dyadobacter sp. CY326]MCE7066204.1 hypothetical protein [Dyadobacter sp. CY326]
MSSSAALYQILYQNETLFRLDSDFVISEKSEVQTVAAEPAQAKQTAPALLTADNPTLQPDSKPTPAPPPAAIFPTLQHSILILIDEPKQKQVDSSESVFLDNILKAVGHSIDKADIINYSFLKGPDARKVLSEKQTNFFITFGVPLIKLHLDLLLIPYTPKLVEGVWFLLTDPLPVIEADRDLKKKLWQALKKMFEMS